MSEAHSKFSASASARWMSCPGSTVLSEGKSEKPSKYAAEGTVAHQVASWCLEEGKDAAAYVGRVVQADGFSFTVDDEMAGHVQTYVDQVREYAVGGTLLVEQRVHYHEAIGVDEGDGFGTSDALIFKPKLLSVHDLKFGRGEEVDAEDNTQMILYAGGSLALLDTLGETDEIERVLMVIHQPRTSSKPREWEISVTELRERLKAANEAAQRVFDARADYPAGDWHEKYTEATEKGCKWCKAKATCPTLREKVTEAVFDQVPATAEEFGELKPMDATVASAAEDKGVTWLAGALSQVDLIEDWCKAIRAEAESRMLAGAAVPGFKLVQGKKGNRAWSDAAAAQELLKGMRLRTEEMFDLELKSPTQIAKLGPKFDKEGKVVKTDVPPVIGPRQWPKVQALITQGAGKVHVAPNTDPREAIVIAPVETEFEVVGQPADSCDDLV